MIAIENNAEFAKRMRMKRIPWVKCIWCGAKTHVDEGLHACLGLTAERIGDVWFLEAKCSRGSLCKGCAHCKKCGKEHAKRVKAHRLHDERLAKERKKHDDERKLVRELLDSRSPDAPKLVDAATLGADLPVRQDEFATVMGSGDHQAKGEIIVRMFKHGQLMIRNVRWQGSATGVLSVFFEMEGAVEPVPTEVPEEALRDIVLTDPPYVDYDGREPVPPSKS